jgi:uncharacterized protein (TIGR03437 family)
MLLAGCAVAQNAAFHWIRQIGGSGTEALAGLATDAQGNTYLAGTTTSLDFPVVNAMQPRPAGSGLFRIDGPGSNWRNLYQAGVLTGGRVLQDPRNRGTVYTVADTRLLKSTDGGDTWQTVGTAPASIADFDVAGDGSVYLAASRSGLLKSTDGGATFSAINNGVPIVAFNQPYALHIWANPNHPTILFSIIGYENGYTMARSGDAGASWQLLNNVLPGLGIVTFDPLTPGKVYVGAFDRALVSLDDGVTWKMLGKVADSTWQPAMIVADPGHPGVLYGPSQDALWKSTDSGSTWTRLSYTPTPIVAIDASTDAAYAVQGTQIIMSADGFQTTSAVGPPAINYAVALTAIGGHVFVGAQASSDVFIAKLDPDGNTLWATYLGGSSIDSAQAMTVDRSGAVYVTGITQSADFPVTPGAYATSGRAFVVKMNSDGTVAWSTYWAAQPNTIAVDSAGHAYIAGISYGQMPTTAGSYQPTFQGTFCGVGCLISIPPTNGFVTEFDAAGASLVFSTYLGKQTESASAIGLFPDSSLLVAGQSGLYHLDPAGSSLLGTKALPALIRSFTPDGTGNLLAAGTSTPYTGLPPFPSTAGVVQPSPYPVVGLSGAQQNTGPGDGFVMRLDSQLTVVTATLLGGEAPDSAFSAAPASDGSIIVGGSTDSKAFPTIGTLQSSFASQTGFLAQLNSDFSALFFSSFMGDTRNFYVGSVATTRDGGIVFGGTTSSPPAGVALPLGGVPLAAFPGDGFKAFAVRIDLVKPSALRIDSVVNAASQLAVPLSQREAIQVHGAGFGDDATLLLDGNPLVLIAHDSKTLTTQVPADYSATASSIEVRSGGSKADVAVPGAVSAPGIFSQDGSGLGSGYILNKDGTLNSPSNPAKEGEEITIYATGVGPMTFNQGYAETSTPVVVSVDGFYANGIAAVLRPVDGLPGDVYQISVYVPRPSDYAAQNPSLTGFVMPPMVGVTITIDGASSQAGIAVYVTH